jgi:hypothetical protein
MTFEYDDDARDEAARYPLSTEVLDDLRARAAAIAIKLLLRRRAPTGGWFTDSSHGEGTFGVLGTMFTVMLAFIIFLALESYTRAREGSSVEAIAVTKLHSTAELFPAPSSDRLQGGLVCYARAVIDDGCVR